MNELRGLRGKVAVVTGASRGIGQAIAFRFATAGSRIVLVCRDEASCVQRATSIQEQGGICLSIGADVCKVSDVENAVETVISHFGQIDFLINNAGIEGVGGLLDLTEAAWYKVFETNVKSVFFFSKAVLRHMQEAGHGAIINIASQAGIRGEPYNSLYSASKSAVIGFTQAVALEFAQYGIRANCVCPGPVDTDLLKRSLREFSKYYATKTEELHQRLVTQVPLQRFASSEEVANVVAFLCSDEASFVTGVSLPVSGGMMLH